MASDLSVGEVAARSGVAVSAVHFYERKGLIASSRTNGNQRRFDRHVLRRLAVIRTAQQLGIPLAEVAEALGPIPAHKALSKADWAAITGRWQQKLNERITVLKRLRDELTGCIGCGCLSMETCPLYNAEDALAREGAGPRRLLRGNEAPIGSAGGLARQGD